MRGITYEIVSPCGGEGISADKESGFTKFPPRLPEQPIFYPVLNKEYAAEIASKWNTADENSGYKGYVLEFEVDDEYISRFKVQIVGAHYHKELWVPAEELNEFNSHIKGLISVAEVYGS